MAAPKTSEDPLFDALRDLLVALLREASEIEQQLMIQYLYAAFSLKKYPDRTCSPAQYEAVRRWGSTILLVARSEMEHLALVNGMLTAIGEEPFFDRRNIPKQSTYFLGGNLAKGRDRGRGTEPCDIPFVFEPFSLATIERFVCAESPSKQTLVDNGLPVPEWCFTCDEARQEAGVELAESGISDEQWTRAQQALAEVRGAALESGDSIRPGTIQELYKLIELLFEVLSSRGNLFTGSPSGQVFIPIEYQISVFPITDLSSTKAAIKQIVEEGEGIDAPPDFQSHFLRFFRVRDELVALLAQDPSFEPSLPLPENPKADQITNPFAKQLFELFNYTYATLVFLLTALYRSFQPQAGQSYPFLSSALQEAAFGPMMTMLIRPISEIMACTQSGDGVHTTGPDYHLSPADRNLLAHPDAQLENIEFFLCRLDEIVRRLDALSALDLKKAAREAGDVHFLDRQLRFVYESAAALANNTRRIYQVGELPEFVVNPPQS